jgi:hypothetical protein
MTIVLIDTNAVHRDPWMRNEPGTDLLAAAAAGECRVVLPKVVVDELRRQQADWLKEHREELTKTIEDMRGNPVDVEAMAGALEKNLDDMQSQIDSSFEALLDQDGVEVAPVPTDVNESLVMRDLARRRPFQEKGSDNWSTGFRDAVIWETVLAVLEEVPDDEKLIFVTDDHGFLAEGWKSLHEDLLNDLDARGIDHSRVEVAQTTFAARAAAGKQADYAERVRLATDALFELAEVEIQGHVDSDGGYRMPDFVEFSLPYMESAQITGIGQLTSFVFEPAEPHGDGTIVAKAEVQLSLEGATYKGDFPWDEADEEGSITIFGDLNEHYFETGTEIVVDVVATIDTSGGLGHYEVERIVLVQKTDIA